MKWFRSISIICSLALITAFSIADDGALGKKKGGKENDSGKSSGGDSGKRSGGDSGKSSGGDSGKSSGGGSGKSSGGDSGKSSGGDSGKSSGGDGHGSWVDKNKSSGGDRTNGDKARDDKTGNGGSSKGNSNGNGNSGGDKNQDRGRDDINKKGRDQGDNNNNSGSGSKSNGNGNSVGDRSQDRGRDNGNSRGNDDLNRKGRGQGDDNSTRSGGSTNTSGRTDGSRVDGARSGSSTVNDPLNRRKPGSTSVRYGTDNNRSRDSKSNQSSIGRAPIDVFSGSLKSQVRREDNVRSHRDYRIGYSHYKRDWNDDNWFGSIYIFVPSYDICVVSPFYYCTFLPPYIKRSGVVVIQVNNYLYPRDGYTYYWTQGRNYRYVRPSWYDVSSNSSELDKALSDLIYAFEENDRRSISRLIPSRGNVGIYLDERYDYSMNADDFYDLMVDNVANANTRRYEILNVKTYRNEVRVVARHEYVDSYGNNCTLYHTYRMVSGRNGYEIVEFGTSDYRPRD